MTNGQVEKQRRVPEHCFIQVTLDHGWICLTAMKCKLYSRLLAPIFVPGAEANPNSLVFQYTKTVTFQAFYGLLGDSTDSKQFNSYPSVNKNN